MYSFASGTILSAGTCSPSTPGTQPVSLNISPASFRRANSPLVTTFLMIDSIGSHSPRNGGKWGCSHFRQEPEHTGHEVFAARARRGVPARWIILDAGCPRARVPQEIRTAGRLYPVQPAGVKAWARAGADCAPRSAPRSPGKTPFGPR